MRVRRPNSKVGIHRTVGGHSGRLNLDCPVVKTHIRRAYRELIEILNRTGRPDEARLYQMEGF